MTKILISSFLFMIIQLSSFSQTAANITWSKEHKIDDNEIFGLIRNSSEKGFYTQNILFDSYKKIVGHTIRKWDINFNLIASHVLVPDKGKGSRSLDQFYFQEKKIVVLSSQYSKKDETYRFYKETLNEDNLTSNNDLEIYHTIKKPSNSVNRKLYYQVRFNEKHQKLVLGFYEEEKKTFTVFDNQFKTIWSNHVTLDIDHGNNRVESFYVDSIGNLALITSKSQKNQYHFNLITFKNNGELVSNLALNTDDKFIDKMLFVKTKQQELVGAALYSIKNDEYVDGVFYVKANLENGNVDYKVTPLDNKIATFNLSKKDSIAYLNKINKGKNVDLPRFKLDHLINSHNGVTLMCEESYKHEFTSSTGHNVFYVNNDILAINLTTQGDIHWSSVIPKRQRTQHDRGLKSSFCNIFTDDQKMHVFFNDNLKNLTKQKKQATTNSWRHNSTKNSFLHITTLDKEGKFKNSPVLYSKEITQIIQPRSSNILDDNKIIIYATDRNSFRFGLLTLNN